VEDALVPTTVTVMVCCPADSGVDPTNPNTVVTVGL
jgi:hypothetical protein